ncbi:MAG: hypothetical protein J0L75_18000, partial [Spirochaetes bacterium]|nr:hypothetical protein [Spirochaetota bacterium]
MKALFLASIIAQIQIHGRRVKVEFLPVFAAAFFAVALLSWWDAKAFSSVWVRLSWAGVIIGVALAGLWWERLFIAAASLGDRLKGRPGAAEELKEYFRQRLLPGTRIASRVWEFLLVASFLSIVEFGFGSSSEGDALGKIAIAWIQSISFSLALSIVLLALGFALRRILRGMAFLWVDALPWFFLECGLLVLLSSEAAGPISIREIFAHRWDFLLLIVLQAFFWDKIVVFAHFLSFHLRFRRDDFPHWHSAYLKTLDPDAAQSETVETSGAPSHGALDTLVSRIRPLLRRSGAEASRWALARAAQLAHGASTYRKGLVRLGIGLAALILLALGSYLALGWVTARAVSVSPNGEVGERVQLRVAFNVPVEPRGGIPVFRIEPALPGTLEQPDEKTLLFIPQEALPPATAFRFSVDGRALKSAKRSWIFSARGAIHT